MSDQIRRVLQNEKTSESTHQICARRWAIESVRHAAIIDWSTRGTCATLHVQGTVFLARTATSGQHRIAPAAMPARFHWVHACA